MTDKITSEMRDKLRKPLPPEAVSQHPTKKYLSSIKSIYVVERINDVFGLGSWTLKSEVVERLEKFVVVKSILEIPEFGFYGEAYGGNDNVDIGDAYKGATTDGLTKIAAQQLEIGIDVFKGHSITTSASTEKPPTQKTTTKPPASKTTKAPALKNASELMARAAKFGISSRDVLEANGVGKPEDIKDLEAAWVATATKFKATIKSAQETPAPESESKPTPEPTPEATETVVWIKESLPKIKWPEKTAASWLASKFQLKGGLLDDIMAGLSADQMAVFVKEIKDRLEIASSQRG